MIAARIREEEERRVQEALENRKKHTQKGVLCPSPVSLLNACSY